MRSKPHIWKNRNCWSVSKCGCKYYPKDEHTKFNFASQAFVGTLNYTLKAKRDATAR